MDFQDRGMVTDLTYLDVTILGGTYQWRLTEDDDDDEDDEDELKMMKMMKMMKTMWVMSMKMVPVDV